MTPSNAWETSPRRVIIIDDNPDIHKDFATILAAKSDVSQLDALENELFGNVHTPPSRPAPQYDLSFASQGEPGVEKIRHARTNQRPYQLAFVDMRMPPGWDGMRTIAEALRIDPDIQIVLCTAYSDYSWNEINEQLGMPDNLLILKKPFDSAEVSQLASTLTQKWHLALEARLKRESLEELVRERTQTLEIRNAQLEQEITDRRAVESQLVRSQKMEAIGTMAAGVAHDLNNILSGILSYPDLLLMKMPKDDPMRRPLSVIRQSGHKAAAIVQDLLTLARHTVAIKEPIDVAAMASNCLESPECLAVRAHHPDVRIIRRFDTQLPNVEGSAVHLEKMLNNLLSNAAESMDDGGTIGVVLSVETITQPLPGYTTVAPGDYVNLTVTDEGGGIHKDDIDHIFEPFFTKKKLGRSGTGLGMTVVWDTVTHHNGYIRVESRLGKGTSISVFLPVALQPMDLAMDTIEIEYLGGSGERVLVVDDIAEQREIASEIFQELGYEVDAVASGEEALAFIENQPVDVLVLDMVMDPGIDGLSTYQQALHRFPEQRAVIASGYTKNERIQSALELGALFVKKPYHLKEIAKAVRHVLYRR